MTRDSPIWNVLLVVGSVASATLIAGNAADYGMGAVAFKWLQLLALGVSVVGGKNSNSWVKGENDGR
jgi:hypothetical protein